MTKHRLSQRRAEALQAVEECRARYRPKKILTLFVGESAPAGGTFFYFGNSGMARYMQQVFPPQGGDFLEAFKERGWYLVWQF
jgi:hypothetical protein